MPDLFPSWTWISLIALGSFHGLNPAMGWLFAVARGLQERRTSAVTAALRPIAVGHALAIAVVVVVVWLLGTVLPQGALTLAGGVSMLGFAAYKVVTRFRHPTWVGMRVRSRDLVAWSFLMATAHGAGLMLVPSLLELRGDGVPVAEAHMGAHGHHFPSTGSGAEDIVTSVLAVGVHTAAMFVVGGALAMVVYRKIGVDVLRRAWINVDLIWIGVLALAGTLTIGFGAWGIVAS